MRFPNLVWAVARRGLTHYQVAGSVPMSESRFSRCLAGRSEFSGAEQERIAQLLGYQPDWLFQQISPPEANQTFRPVGLACGARGNQTSCGHEIPHARVGSTRAMTMLGLGMV